MALISTIPSPAMSATAEPETPAKIIEATTLTWASPARRWPTRAMAKLKILSVRPVAFIRLPAMMKRGTASRAGFSTPSRTISGSTVKLVREAGDQERRQHGGADGHGHRHRDQDESDETDEQDPCHGRSVLRFPVRRRLGDPSEGIDDGDQVGHGDQQAGREQRGSTWCSAAVPPSRWSLPGWPGPGGRATSSPPSAPARCRRSGGATPSWPAARNGRSGH